MIRPFSGWCLAAFLCVPASAAAQQRSLAAATSSDVAAGQRIFDAQCAWCHGAAGTGGTGPDLHRTRCATRPPIAALVDDRAQRHSGHGDAGVHHRADRAHGVADRGVRALARPRPRASAARQRRSAARRSTNRTAAASCHIVQRTRRRARSGADQHRRAARRAVPARRARQTGSRASAGLSRRRARCTTAGTASAASASTRTCSGSTSATRGGTVHTLREIGRCRALDRELEGTLMPSYASRLSAAELDDLVAYLATLARCDR